MNTTTDRFTEAKEELRDRSLPTVDVAALLDDIEYYEQNGYPGSIRLDPEKPIGGAVFDVGVHVGFACGFREIAFRDALTSWIEQNRGNLDGNASEYARGYEVCLNRLEEFIQEELG